MFGNVALAIIILIEFTADYFISMSFDITIIRVITASSVPPF